MLDRKFLRNNYEVASQLLKTRGVAGETLEEYRQLDVERRELLVQVEELKQSRNTASQEIAALKREKQDATDRIEQMQALGQQIGQLEHQLSEVEGKLEHIEHRFPNVPHESTPVGEDEDDNVEIRRWGELPQFDFEPLNHWDIAEKLGILDFERGGKVAGSRFVYYVGLGARLERAIYNFMLDKHTTQNGYQEVIPPYIVNEQAMFGTGQFPKFTEDVFQLNDDRGFTLIPTAEVPLTNYYSNEIIPEDALPIRLTALSPSFRSEAGSAGRDTRGLIRMHQFNKVELVKLTHPSQSYQELELMTQNAEEILQDLGIPYRTIVLCTCLLYTSDAATKA